MGRTSPFERFTLSPGDVPGDMVSLLLFFFLSSTELRLLTSLIVEPDCPPGTLPRFARCLAFLTRQRSRVASSEPLDLVDSPNRASISLAVLRDVSGDSPVDIKMSTRSKIEGVFSLIRPPP